MKIIAVIPARQGSKGIPNKNIRLLNGKPMVYYAISNALSSKYITDVVVTTDSDEIATIARQTGAAVRMRDPALAGDAVTLDSVVFDAVSEGAWDYVVTMQPTSPTLRVETLDSAIKYCIVKNLDTLISVVNKPHLAWADGDNGKKIPAYTERKNRQELPNYYLETGAFLISRGSVITKTSRFGENIDVYEIPNSEALDIDTFEDLVLAEHLLCRKNAAIYVNGNTARGLGHIYRSLEIADTLYHKPDIYYDVNQTAEDAFGDTTHTLIGIDGLSELFEKLSKNAYDIVVSDILSTTADYMITLKKAAPNAKLVNFEDDGEGAGYADLVINELYHDAAYPHMKVGEKYYIAPKLFMLYNPIEISNKVEHILISFGGSDPRGYTERLLSIISKPKYDSFSFTVVLGRGKNNAETLLEYNKKTNIEVLHDITNMPEVMSKCDIAITSRGRTAYELAFLGIPTIAMAQNEREEKHGFVCDDNGYCYLGLDPNDECISGTLDIFLKMPQAERQKRQDALLSHDLHGGRARVQNLLDSLF